MQNSLSYLLTNDLKLAEYIKNSYADGMSFSQMASEIGTYPNFIIRKARKLTNIKIRNKSETQSTAIKMGRHKHPTKGVKRSEEAKIKIGTSVSRTWNKTSPTEKERRAEICREIWNKKSEKEKQELIRKSNEAIRKASRIGSTLERYLAKKLIENGYRVECHKEHFVTKERLQIDLYLPDNSIAIEVDGPSHFRNVWGDQNLKRTQQSDQEKTGLLLARGLKVIRIKQIKYLSEVYKRKILTELLNLIKNIPNTAAQYYEIKV